MRVRSLFTATLVVVVVAGIASLSHAAPTCFGRTATKTGTPGPDLIRGTSGADVIVALGGHDTVRALGGNDRICGGGGNDDLYGQTGNDLAAGQGGRDFLSGGLGTTDSLFGGPDFDRLDGGGGTPVGSDGADRFNGGNGVDIVQYVNASRAITANLSTGIGRGEGADSFVAIEGLSGSRYADDLTGNGAHYNPLEGNDGNDVLDAGGGELNELYGGNGNDRMTGTDNPGDGYDFFQAGDGNDILVGNGGPRDIFHGEDGDDTMTGGWGADRFFGNLELGVDTAYGLGGNDHIDVVDREANDTANGGAGDDDCFGDDGDVLISC